MKTIILNPAEVEKKWYVIDATELPLGRLASRTAMILMGKNKAAFSPNHDNGDYVVIVNADKVVLTGQKEQKKQYFTHSQYSGGGKVLSYTELKEKGAERPLMHAVKGMLPHNSLGKGMIKKLHVYGGAEHPHSAQKPQALTLKLK
jgi:large subunit ribosomal protein L13